MSETTDPAAQVAAFRATVERLSEIAEREGIHPDEDSRGVCMCVWCQTFAPVLYDALSTGQVGRTWMEDLQGTRPGELVPTLLAKGKAFDFIVSQSDVPGATLDDYLDAATVYATEETGVDIHRMTGEVRAAVAQRGAQPATPPASPSGRGSIGLAGGRQE